MNELLCALGGLFLAGVLGIVVATALAVVLKLLRFDVLFEWLTRP